MWFASPTEDALIDTPFEGETQYLYWEDKVTQRLFGEPVVSIVDVVQREEYCHRVLAHRACPPSHTDISAVSALGATIFLMRLNWLLRDDAFRAAKTSCNSTAPTRQSQISPAINAAL
jgi:hypothetical protein